MVVCAHPEAAKVGRHVLARGGNAVDAAVAVQFALAVVYPNAGNIGGGGFLVWRSAKGEVLSLDFREKAPRLATRDMFLDEQKRPVTRLSLEGGLASGVPGSVDGMVTAHKRLGSLAWKSLVQPAIHLAKSGFRVTDKQADELNAFDAQLRRWNDSSCALLKKRPWKAGDLLRQPELALTLEAIRDRGRAGFYEGACAQAILSCMRQRDGLIDSIDLRDYASVWRAPVRSHFRECEIYSMAPPSSGGIALAQMLTLWQARTPTLPAYHSAEHLHLMTEIQRRVYADRSEWLGDPDFVKVPMRAMLSQQYLNDRMSDYWADSATPSARIKAGPAERYESEQTTHFSIVDAQLNAVSLTTTLNASYGSKLMVPGAGFLLNNEMDDFSAKAGSPNMYGLLGNDRNAVTAGKRMLSSMTPTIVTRHDSLLMVLGSPGGGTIMNSVCQTIINVLDYGMTMQQAVSSPRFHSQWMPDALYVEDGLLKDGVLEKLEGMGHTMKPRGPMGRVDAILIVPGGTMQPGADPRGDDSVGAF